MPGRNPGLDGIAGGRSPGGLGRPGKEPGVVVRATGGRTGCDGSGRGPPITGREGGGTATLGDVMGTTGRATVLGGADGGGAAAGGVGGGAAGD
jgi:hypothetical protein